VRGRASLERAELVTRIRAALASGEGELGIEIAVEADVVTLRGVVQSHERRGRVEAVSRIFAGGLEVANEIAVVAPRAPDRPPEALP
jgi:hypothetical protein